jgi:hypothetical protein
MPDDPSNKQGSDSDAARSPTVGEHANRRRAPRFLFIAEVEVTDSNSGAKLSARVSEIGLGGCYVDTLNPFPEGSLVTIHILKDDGVFQAPAKVIYIHPGLGMGICFQGPTPEQAGTLRKWIAKLE